MGESVNEQTCEAVMSEAEGPGKSKTVLAVKNNLCLLYTSPFIKKIDEFDIIHTDRLHVAILACLLHKRVHFYKGAIGVISFPQRLISIFLSLIHISGLL